MISLFDSVTLKMPNTSNKSIFLDNWDETIPINSRSSEDENVKLIVTVSIMLVIILACATLHKISQCKMTFINGLVVSDCLISLCHIPMILQVLL